MTMCKRVLLVASVGDDALALMRLRAQLYGLMQPPVHIDTLAVARGDDALAQAVAAAAMGRYDSACCATTEGVFVPVVESAVLPAFKELGKQALEKGEPWRYGRAGHGEEIIVIARPERLAELVHEAGRSWPEVRIASAKLRAAKNEWIEAGFLAAQLASEAGQRRLLVLPGKNYVLEDDAELFSAVLENGCVVEASDLRAFVFLVGRIDFAKANFTAAQLAQAGSLPTELTPVYVDGAGRLTLSGQYEALVEKLGGGDALRVKCGAMSHIAWQAPQEGLKLLKKRGLTQLALPHGSAWELLGRPQPGDVVQLSRAAEEALEAA